MVGQFKKPYLQISQDSTFSHTRENSKMFNITPKGCLCSSTLGPQSPKYWKNKFMNKACYLFKIKSYLERPSYGVQNKWKGVSSQCLFSSITKETEKNFMVKYIQQIRNFIVFPKCKNLFFLNVKTYKPQTCSICSEYSSP